MRKFLNTSFRDKLFEILATQGRIARLYILKLIKPCSKPHTCWSYHLNYIYCDPLLLFFFSSVLQIKIPVFLGFSAQSCGGFKALHAPLNLCFAAAAPRFIWCAQKSKLYRELILAPVAIAELLPRGVICNAAARATFKSSCTVRLGRAEHI